ncbi:OVARIAN TUMOR DOMAIN-containing deubiquitinating enzyme 4 [Cornus florida]|uniref:OVARIAN TUMOR DOMAIN-containing deubiquitinating enzyme 4 n=1 Tax=Cornus florida TaxID=4283 RepID=UPI00289D378E|nr:OVARIAN TUMOR DOMAIN-containing deubiquitinating enzyme 4 [Cornus florida]XP_059646346.1 OVARIAN TUMOR DOMAIN-containing deubiquitinating enzyme 4 [Cornus florida]XP_059646347.1 OVARIAN TUMOR DOMAIN-containing deubiquitinating enzyme 4 [Cornus florida]XP_059646348.1 OVARIAN TUMOR DOMAIN-containing deubiquitinating enzyme 4 [Cornus florida]XP_059646349.1 OVARIAN TUMOR DOMAIN-containing deubiquitinating enzyme 4 [Cornus florida]XP_059646350.1 OVARIAN TUMOR DOMAIN-containing deubiquitinating e
MVVYFPISRCARNVVRLSGHVQRRMRNVVCAMVSQVPSSSCCLHVSSGHSGSKYANMSVSKAHSCSSVISFRAFQGSCFGSSNSKQRDNWNSLTVRSIVSSQKTCFDISWGCQDMNMKLLAPKHRTIRKTKCRVGSVSSWARGCASAGLIFGLLVCYSSPEPVHAESAQAKENKEDDCDSSSVGFSHGKKVYTDYSIIGIPGDGRCLFRSVAHGACLRSGKPTPSDSLQRELADELRARVADEFVRRRKETEWFIEGDFDIYVSKMRKPHVWGGEPELLMASHVLQMPITVYMYDEDSRGLISIAEYGQEYGKENPIRVLYHGFGHYDALQIPGKQGAKSGL